MWLVQRYIISLLIDKRESFRECSRYDVPQLELNRHAYPDPARTTFQQTQALPQGRGFVSYPALWKLDNERVVCKTTTMIFSELGVGYSRNAARSEKQQRKDVQSKSGVAGLGPAVHDWRKNRFVRRFSFARSVEWKILAVSVRGQCWGAGQLKRVGFRKLLYWHVNDAWRD